MKVGILEDRDDLFIQDVILQLGKEEVEFLSFSEDFWQQSNIYKVIVDRLSYRFLYLREALKIMALRGTYVLNNPFSADASNKLVDYEVSRSIGIPVPKTILLSDTSVGEEIKGLVKEPQWAKIVEELGLPCVIKPYNGYGWFDVYIVNSLEEIQKAYESCNNSSLLLAQQFIEYRDYFRVYCIDKKEVLFVRWIPKPLGAGEYLLTDQDNINDKKELISNLTIKLNTILDRDINAMEWCFDKEGEPWAIDTYNEVPDIHKGRLPEPHYRWIVEKFVKSIKDKMQSDVRNKHIFDYKV